MAEATNYPKVAQLKDVAAFRARLAELGISLPMDDRVLSAAEGSPLAQPITVAGFEVGNRWCIHPMEGWDANRDGSPSPHTLRRWRNFGLSGAKLIWGGEAAAVRPDGRANPNQTMAIASNLEGLKALRRELSEAHLESFGSLDGLFIGLQLTHSGRFCKPDDHHRSAPKIAYHHPLLDEKFRIDPQDPSVVWTDAELETLIDDYVAAAHVAHKAGYQFVDVKACHGYLLHEFLSARTRPGKFGGDLAGRSRVLTSIIDRVRDELPGLAIGVRLSVFDFPPFVSGGLGLVTRGDSKDAGSSPQSPAPSPRSAVGQPMDFEKLLPYEYGFGCDPKNPLAIDLTEPLELMRDLVSRGVSILNVTCGSPYYNPHMQRPAIFPPFDGYLPPEDPLVGAWRQIDTVRRCREALSGEERGARSENSTLDPQSSILIPLVGSGYTYLQEYLLLVAQAAVREGWVDFVGLGRMVLSYPELPADTLAGKQPERKRICRTFSDCTTAPRNGLVSGCYPLDPYYKDLPEREELIAIKQKWQK